jgi:hypothetical protein
LFDQQYAHQAEFDNGKVEFNLRDSSEFIIMEGLVVDREGKTVNGVNIFENVTYQGTVPNPEMGNTFKLVMKSNVSNVSFSKAGFCNFEVQIDKYRKKE